MRQSFQHLQSRERLQTDHPSAIPKLWIVYEIEYALCLGLGIDDMERQISASQMEN